MELNDSSVVIAIDLGGTKVAGALFDVRGRLLEKSSRLREGREGAAVGALIVDLARGLLDAARQRGLAVGAAGVGVPGIYWSKSGRVWAPNIPGWEEYPLREELERELGGERIRVAIDSDRACYILGETWQGCAAGCSDAIFLAVGTGIGAGILVDGRIVRGHSDIAGAVGWLALGPAELPERPEGSFEAFASGEGIVRAARHLMEREGKLINLPDKGRIGNPTTRDLFAAYAAGDEVAGQVVRMAVAFWGRAAANLVSIFNPEKIIFGGGVFGPAAPLLENIRAEAERWAQPISMRQVRLEVSRLGGDAGLYGAAYLAL